MGFAAFMLLATGILNDFPASAQANFVNPTSPATTQAGLPNQKTGEIAGTTWQGQKGIVQTTRQIMDRKKNNLKPARPRPILPVRSRSASTGQPATTDGAVQAEISSTISEPKAAANPLQAAFLPTVDNTFPGYPITPDIPNLPYQPIPPDTMGAVGPTQFMMAINGLLRVFNKETGIREPAFGEPDPDLDTFFSAVMSVSANNYTNFPRVRYDRYSSRWILLVNDVPGGEAKLPNRILLAVSDGPIISQATVWSEYYFQPGALLPGNNQNLFANYPTLGVDANALYIGVNLYSTNNFAFSNTAAFVVKKSSILNGGPISVTTFPPLIDSSGNGPFTPQGVDNLDSSVDEGYFIGVNLTSNNPIPPQLQLRRVTNPGGNNTSISANIPIDINPTALPLKVPHKFDPFVYPSGQPDNAKLDPIDDRLLNATIRKGNLWTVHNVGVNSSGVSNDTSKKPDRNGSRWYNIKLSNTTLAQSGTAFDTSNYTKFYWLPSIAINGQGHAVMGFNVAGPNEYISAGVAEKMNGEADFAEPILYHTSPSIYNPAQTLASHRWGDYSYTSLDPEDDMTFWTIQEFAYNSDSYGIQIAKLKAPPTATPLPLGSNLDPGLQSVNITISGTSTYGSGFFDSGPGFAKRFKVSIDGEILVNSITSVSPTSIALNVSTIFATTGTHTVTVTNPDGQSITVADVITVSNYSCTQPVNNSAADGASDSLRQAILAASKGGCKTLIFNNLNSINLTQATTVSVPAGVTITTNKACSLGQVEITGTNLTDVLTPVLSLNGGIFFGITVRGFNVRQIEAKSGLNQLKCITTNRT